MNIAGKMVKWSVGVLDVLVSVVKVYRRCILWDRRMLVPHLPWQARQVFAVAAATKCVIAGIMKIIARVITTAGRSNIFLFHKLP